MGEADVDTNLKSLSLSWLLIKTYRKGWITLEMITDRVDNTKIYILYQSWCMEEW